jgi:NADH-quinone oxidoreductase subunit L
MSQTLNASTLLAVPLAPLVGAALAGIFGTKLGGNLVGRRGAHTLTILGVLVAFLISAASMKPSMNGWSWAASRWKSAS